MSSVRVNLDGKLAELNEQKARSTDLDEKLKQSESSNGHLGEKLVI